VMKSLNLSHEDAHCTGFWSDDGKTWQSCIPSMQCG